jgi:hypothetical protein
VLLDDDRCGEIDTGLGFPVADQLRTVIWEFALDPIDAAILERLDAVAQGDVEVLRGLLAPEEVAATQRRSATLLAAGVLPEPEHRGHYPPWPWPIV